MNSYFSSVYFIYLFIFVDEITKNKKDPFLFMYQNLFKKKKKTLVKNLTFFYSFLIYIYLLLFIIKLKNKL
jgi:hypothetical protein